jgi:hypothetical protein
MAQELESSEEQRVLPQSDTGMSAFFKILASKIPSSPHPVSQGRDVYTTNPQVNPDIMCPKPPTLEPLTSTSTIAGSTPKPSSSAPPVRESKQPDAATLAMLGIKVRDFAYESTLPPVKPVHLLPRQIQPGLRTLKRIRDGEVEDVFSQPTAGSAEEGEGSSSKKSKLERTMTEPVLETGIPPTRARGFANLEEYDPATDSQLIINSQQSDLGASQPPPLVFESQESEPYIDTPFVTPNGSLQWPVANRSAIPASQLDTASQEAGPEPLSYAELGLDECSQRQVLKASSSVLSDPPTSPVPFASDCLPGPFTMRSPCLGFPATASAESRSANASPTSPTPRYHLRKRAVGKSSPTRRDVLPSKHVTSRAMGCSMQSSHSRVNNGNGSPRSRIIRTRNAARNTNDDR